MEIVKNNQLVPVSSEMLLPLQSSRTDLTKSDVPTFVVEIKQKYGSLETLKHRLSFDKIGIVANDVVKALTADVPSFTRLDKTFGSGSSKIWLFEHLKSMFLKCGVTSDKMADVQIVALAEIIVARYPWLKLSEFMLFEAYFLTGQYGRFYGDNSYFLVVTEGVLKFLEERNRLYDRIEREANEAKLAAQKPGITWEEYCHSKGIVGTPPPPGHLTYNRMLEDKRNKEQLLIQEALKSARGVIAMKAKLSNDDYGAMCYAYKKRYGCSPERFIKDHENNSESSEDNSINI